MKSLLILLYILLNNIRPPHGTSKVTLRENKIVSKKGKKERRKKETENTLFSLDELYR